MNEWKGTNGRLAVNVGGEREGSKKRIESKLIKNEYKSVEEKKIVVEREVMNEDKRDELIREEKERNYYKL